MTCWVWPQGQCYGRGDRYIGFPNQVTGSTLPPYLCPGLCEGMRDQIEVGNLWIESGWHVPAVLCWRPKPCRQVESQD